MSEQTVTTGSGLESFRQTPIGEGILNLQGLADYWGVGDLEELKRVVRREGVPYFMIGRASAGKIHWDRARFRLDHVRIWEEEHSCVYAERNPGPESSGKEERPRSALRCRKR